MNLPVEATTEDRPVATEFAPARVYGRVTARAVLLALLLTVINDYWIVQLEVVRYSFATYAAPFYNCIFTLLVVTAANQWLKKRRPRVALTRVELITIYVMVSVSSAVCSHNMMQVLVSLMGYAYFFKTPENGWGPKFADHLPSWLTVNDNTSLQNFYYGNSTLYTHANYAPWIVPALCWSMFCAVLLFTMLCINSILRKQWVESERLSFPIVLLPLEMTQDGAPLFRNRYMWMGFAVAGVITFVAGLHYLYPSIPYIRIVRQDVGHLITQLPWRAIGGISIAFYFWAIGLAFMMPLELSFSCWVFFWLTRLERVGAVMLGLNEVRVLGGGFGNTYPFLSSQAYGAYIGFFVMSMWTSRRYLGRVFRTAFLGTEEEDDSREAISYRGAIIGAVSGFLFLSVFARAMGMSVPMIIVFFVLYFVLVVMISRIRAELGFPTHDMQGMTSPYSITTAVGTQNIAKTDLIGFSLFHWFNRNFASHPAPHQLESFKLSEGSNSTARQMFYAVMIAGIFAMPIGFWMLLHMYYHNGGATANVEMWACGFGGEVWNRLDGWLKQPLPPNPTAMSFVGVGFLVSMFLSWMRVRFLWFPLHPLAYAIADSWGVYQLWLPIMIGCIAKFMTLKFGGLGAYRKALPFFFGLILGEVTVGSLWTIAGIVVGIPTYDFWPGRPG